MQSLARLELECIILKSYVNNTLNKSEIDILESILKEFSKDSKVAFEILNELIQNNIYEENYFVSRIAEVTNENFIKEYIKVSKIANLAPLLNEYIRYIRLDRQEALANYLLKETKSFNLLDLNAELLDKYEYSGEVKEFLTFREAEKNLQHNDTSKLYPTGIEFLDTAFDGGIATGQLILVSGDYEAGKTTLTTQLLENVSSRHKVAFFCFEFTIKSYVKRRQDQPNNLFNKDNLYIISDGYDIKDIKSNILKLYKDKGIRIFLIDSQMRIENNTSNANGEEKESEKFEILGKMAHEYDLAIFLIIQTSKADPNTPFKSKKGAHEASIIIHLENVENSKIISKNVSQKRLIVKKNKQTGKHFKEDVWLDLKTGQFAKDPNHQFKDKNYDAKRIINEKELNETLAHFPI